jgi:hypothetical protein
MRQNFREDNLGGT